MLYKLFQTSTFLLEKDKKPLSYSYFGGEDVIGEDPGHGHLDGELDPLAHRHLQVELSVPQLAQVATIL